MLHMTARALEHKGKAGMTRQLLHGAFGYLVMGVYCLTRLQTFVGGSFPRFPVPALARSCMPFRSRRGAFLKPGERQAVSSISPKHAFTSCHVAPF